MVHLAAQAGVRHSLSHPEEYIESNIVGFANLLECCRRHPLEHLVFASSSSVYGASERVPFSVHDGADHPISLYGATKKANEAMAHSYSHLFGIPVTGLRFFTVYGPWGRPDMAYFSFTRKMLAGQPIDVFNHGPQPARLHLHRRCRRRRAASARPGARSGFRMGSAGTGSGLQSGRVLPVQRR